MSSSCGDRKSKWCTRKRRNGVVFSCESGHIHSVGQVQHHPVQPSSTIIHSTSTQLSALATDHKRPIPLLEMKLCIGQKNLDRKFILPATDGITPCGNSGNTPLLNKPGTARIWRRGMDRRGPLPTLLLGQRIAGWLLCIYSHAQRARCP